jgi:hypothetical protein
MSAHIDDGGPAFPNNDAHGCAYAGMTLRDWFAGQCLQSYLAGRNFDSRDSNKEAVAGICYRYADAMIEARKGGER